jgi:hypothetical protein
MSERPEFHLWIAVGAVMLLLSLVSLLLFGIASGDSRVVAVLLIAILFLGTLFGAAGAVTFAVSWLNRREDPRHAKRPSDDP